MDLEPVFFTLRSITEVSKGIPTTLALSLLSFLIGLLLGSVLVLIRMFGPRSMVAFASSYIEAFRGTPLLVQIFIVYFGLAQFGLKFSPFEAGVIALGLNSAAYQAEILRSAIQSIPLEQYLSGESLALTRWQIYRHIILPQALRIAVPALMNELVILVKDSSLVSIIGLTPPDIFRRADYITAQTFRAFEAYFAAAIVYFIICFAMVKVSHWVERRFAIPGYLRRGIL